jgi:1-acyl-sn-glycerol-3-phosphate acyltransferase
LNYEPLILILGGALAVLGLLVWVFTNEFHRDRVLRAVTRLVLKIYCRIETEGREHVPRAGALIVAANHASWIDAFALGAAVPRLIHYLAAREYYDLWYMRWFMRLFGTIPLSRGKSAKKPIERAVAALQEGRVIGIFPEGSMSLTGRLGSFKRGIALLAEETGAPIVPVALIGAFEVWGPHLSFPRPRKVRVRIGSPIEVRGLSREQILARLEAALRGMLEL